MMEDSYPSFISQPPGLSPFPMPFNFPNKPVAQVPDVSLIYDSSPVPVESRRQFSGRKSPPILQVTAEEISTNSLSTPQLQFDSIVSPPPQYKCTPTQSPSTIACTLSKNSERSSCNEAVEFEEMKERMGRLEEKLDKIITFQDNFLALIFKKSGLVDQSMQTDDCFPSSTSSSRTSTPATAITTQKKRATSPQNSLSAILLQPPPSAIYSEPSGIKSLQLQEFNDSFGYAQNGSGSEESVLGPSASVYSSDSDDEDKENKIKPTATFYNKVLGNVNRLLEPRPPKTNNGDKGRGSNRNSPNEGQVVYNTKQYLETLGVQFGSPKPLAPAPLPKNNYMIQQNVYNSIYIPTVNCAPVVPEVYDNTGGSTFDSIAHKYLPNGTGETNRAGGTDATVYGMSPTNLSFATKDYLQRYGLVEGRQGLGHEEDRILNITAIKNQPKLL